MIHYWIRIYNNRLIFLLYKTGLTQGLTRTIPIFVIKATTSHLRQTPSPHITLKAEVPLPLEFVELSKSSEDGPIGICQWDSLYVYYWLPWLGPHTLYQGSSPTPHRSLKCFFFLQVSFLVLWYLGKLKLLITLCCLAVISFIQFKQAAWFFIPVQERQKNPYKIPANFYWQHLF